MLLSCGAGEDSSPLGCKEIKPINPKGNQSWIFIGRTDLNPKLQYFGHLIWRADSLEKTLMLRKIESKKIRGWQRVRWLDSITDSMDMSLRKLWEIVEDRGVWHAVVHRVAKSQAQLSDWTTKILSFKKPYLTVYPSQAGLVPFLTVQQHLCLPSS